MRLLVAATFAVAIGCSNREAERRVVPASTTSTFPEPSSSANAFPPPAAQDGANVITIRTNTQETFDDVRLGVGNIRRDTITDDAGSREGWTAAVWIYLRDRPGDAEKVRVHAGQTLTAGKLRFDVVGVDEDAVRLIMAGK